MKTEVTVSLHWIEKNVSTQIVLFIAFSNLLSI